MESKKLEKPRENGTFSTVRGVMKPDEEGRRVFQGYLNRYGLADWGRARYATLKVKASACVQCGACETRCPYNLPIRQMMKKAAEDFGE